MPEHQLARKGETPIRVDAAPLDAFNLARGYWEAKDQKGTLLQQPIEQLASP